MARILKTVCTCLRYFKPSFPFPPHLHSVPASKARGKSLSFPLGGWLGWGYRMLILISSIIFSSCSSNTGKIIIVTGTPAKDPLSPSSDEKIGILDPSRPSAIKILTKDFYSACSPDISCDGKTLLFSGRKNEQDHWQVWEMDISSSRFRQITSCNDNCLFPAYLPDDRILFSRMLQNDSLKSKLSLFRCKQDGSGSERITFNPATWYSSAILSDGRILVNCTQEYPEHGEPQLIVLRPDGTKAEIFYNNKGVLTGSKALETADGQIILTENNGKEPDLISILYNNPFSNSNNLSEGIAGEFISVSTGGGDKLLSCFRSSPAEKFRLLEFDPEEASGKVLHENKDYDVIEAILIKQKDKPKRLPSEVDTLVKTGLLLCQDVNMPDNGYTTSRPAMMEIQGIGVSYGKVKPETDGSFYLKVMADTPFRLATLDKNGKVVRMCKWMSLRPNERRGCTGCHEEPGIVPENRISLAVKRDPVLIPVDVTSIDEKIIELE